MTLDKFIEVTKADVDRFRDQWLASPAKFGKEDWPLRMPEGEWFDQFMTFLNEPAAPTSPTPEAS